MMKKKYVLKLIREEGILMFTVHSIVPDGALSAVVTTPSAKTATDILATSAAAPAREEEEEEEEGVSPAGRWRIEEANSKSHMKETGLRVTVTSR